MAEGNSRLPNPPQRQISAVRFLPQENGDERFICATAWDGTLNLYDTDSHNTRLVLNEKYCKQGMAVLALAASKDGVAFGGMDHDIYVKQFHLESATGQRPGDTAFRIGSHLAPVTAVEYCDTQKLIVTGGQDSNIKLWNVQRDPINCVGNIKTDEQTRTEGQIVRMNVRGNLIAAGLSGHVIGIWDIRNISEPLKILPVRSTSKLSCIAIFPDMKRIVYGSRQGRAFVESILDGSRSKNNFVLNAHVSRSKGKRHPVTCVRFIESTASDFLMGGGDRKVKHWNPDSRTIVKEFDPYPNDIAAIDTSPSGSRAVIACSCECEEGDEVPSPELFLLTTENAQNRNPSSESG